MQYGNARVSPWLRFVRMCTPLLLWSLTAAPSQVNSSQLDPLTVARYYPSGGNGPGAQLFDRKSYRPVIDKAVEEIYAALSENDLNRALLLTDRLLKDFPNFQVGHLLRGDILSLKAGRMVRQIGDIPNAPDSKQDELSDLRAEAIARLKAAKDRPAKDLLPSELVELSNNQKYVILVDTSRSRLFLYENSFPQPRLVTDFYVSQGKMGAVKEKQGDKRTPIGVYTITELLPKQKLTDFYGPIALPINYPNTWDKRHGKTGHGIWLHGIPSNLASRPPKSSDGCVVLANQDLLALKEFVNVGNTRVIISQKLDFVPVDLWQTQRKVAVRMVAQWREDFEKGPSRSTAHYASNAQVNGKDLIEWQKTGVQTSAGPNRVKIDNLNITRYPDDDQEMMLVSFIQEDQSGLETEKNQYWVKNGTRWQIILEESKKL